MRMFAGPNGSGKSTIKSVINQELLGVYINPDEMETEMQNTGFLDLIPYQVQTSPEDVLTFFRQSDLLKNVGLSGDAKKICFRDGKLVFQDVKINSYFASLAADFIRTNLFETGTSFTFETVMSHPSKVELLHKAKNLGYRTYLYYIATEDPEINFSRIQYRIKMGGHSVPQDKMMDRYKRSLELLLPAVHASNRAYIFDNSHEQPIWIAEITDGRTVEIRANEIPAWFNKSLGDKFK